MTFRTRAVLIISAITALLIALIYLISQTILLRSFQELETQSVRHNVEQVLKAYTDDLAQLATTAGDYAGWDDAYAFIEDANSEFIEANLDDQIYPKLRLNALVFIHSSGRVVFARGFDLAQNKAVPVSQHLLAHLDASDPLLQHPTLESVNKGLLLLPEGPLLIVSHPILTSAYTGPSRGSLIMGRYLDEEEIKRLADISQLPLKAYPIDDPQLPLNLKGESSAAVKAGEIRVEPLSGQSIVGAALVSDIYGQPAVLFRVALARDIYQKGKNAIRYFILSFSMISLGFAAIALLLLEKLGASWQAHKESQERYQAVVEQTAEGIFLVDGKTKRLLQANTALRKMLGYHHEAIGELTLYDVMGHSQETVDFDADYILKNRHTLLGEKKLRHKDGSLIDIEISINPVVYSGNEVFCVVARDITERKRAEQHIWNLAHYDALTRLPNRLLLQDRLHNMLLQAQRDRHLIAVLFIDLDRFKAINDSLGHHVGDLLLRAVAERLVNHLRACDTVARQGGDEFIIVLPNPPQVKDAAQVARKIIALLAQPFFLDGHELYITPSIGISIYPYDGEEARVLLKNADAAMYHAKQVGRNTYQFYTTHMNVTSAERLQLENDLRRALERNELALHYQPQVELKSGRIIGAEALLRWQHPELGLVSPAKFIPIAEETSLIVPIGEWVLRTACSQAKQWQAQGLPMLRIAINLSGRQFKQKDLFDVIKNTVQETGMNPRFLELEITESVIMENASKNIAILRVLKLMGIYFSVDDFGTGYSSLSYLKNFPIDTLKIDQSFVRDITSDANDAEIVKAIIAMAHSLRLKVNAEGVETEEQLRFLSEQHCDEAQGYYFSRPLPADEFAQLLKQHCGFTEKAAS